MALSYIVQTVLDVATWSLFRIGVDHLLHVHGAENHLVKIEDSLVEIRNFIVIAEGSPIKDPKLMELLENLKDAAYDAQDLLEEYEIAERRRSEEAANCMPVRDTITNRVRKVVTSGIVSPIIMRQKLKEVSERLEAIKAEAHAFQLEEKVTNLQIEFKKTRETYSPVDVSQVFERDEEKEKIVNSLLSIQAGDHENVSVISIVGIGGIGKTTLAQLVFSHELVQNHFELRMWICVSYDFDIIKLGNEIIERATRDNPSLSHVEELQRRLGEALSGKKFLLVLDDVWNEEPKKWHSLRGLLLCGERGSRIVVTTRSQKVASIMSKIQPYSLKPLSEDGCWSLFCQRAFGNQTEEAEAAHPKLAPIGREIVKKCGGIPLAVTTLGDLLCSERSRRKWEFVRDSEMWNLGDENENGILPALRLSYNHLKPHLMQCFAFCAIFPQDYQIEKELVIKLWMAHGFIPTKRGMELEDIGNDIFDELVMRSFFQDVNVNAEGTTFRMHDLMHDLAHSVMENEYRVVLNGKSKDISPRIRHVSSNGLGILAASLPKAQMLRTYVMLEYVPFQFPCDVGLFKCLRALDFMRQRDKQQVVKQLFTSLGKLQHLRYLNLSFTLIEILPGSLTSLCYLQTLILMHCEELRELPKEMCKLTNLRCLDITDCYKLTHMPPKMGQLSCLQELSNFIVGRTNEIACSGIGELQGLNLRGRLKIQLLQNITDAIDVPRDTLINKPNLTSLDLMWESSTSRYVEFDYLEEDREIEVLEKQELQGHLPLRNLKKLGIFHYGGLNFPSWMMDNTLTELVEITLSGCWRCSHLPPLGELPFLKVLTIDGLKNVECIGNEFYGNEVSGGFPSLEKLDIENMDKLKTWSGLEWKGKRVFPSLKNLYIKYCPMLTTLEFFPDIGGFNVDQGMIIAGSNEFAHVAHELSFLTSLEQLLLDGCHGLKSLPKGIGNLTSLRGLSIHNCPKMASLPRELQRLSALKGLSIFGCHPSLKIRSTKGTGEDSPFLSSSCALYSNYREQKAKNKEDERENMVLKVVKDTAIEYIVQGALDAVKSCLQMGFDFLGAKNHLVKIEDSLVDIHDFIVIAERSPKKDPKLMKLLEKLKDAAYDAQDLLEEYVIEDRRRSEEAANSMPVRDTMTNKARKVSISLVTAAPAVINREQIAMKVKEISKRLEVIKAEAHAFQLEEKVTNLLIEFKKTRETYSAMDESQVFGRDEEKMVIVSLLLSPQPQVGDGVEDDENENVSVIPIVGMGGLGKTTLAKLVLNHEVVQVHFELRMWICVSYNFDIIRLGNEIIECATRHNPSLSKVEEVQCRLGETLSGKKFLLVLDDVWNEEPEKWYRLRDLLLCGRRGSRIVVTTRSPKVASIMSNIQPQILKPLSEDGCWFLFCQRAFGNPGADPNLAPIGREIVKKCGGIPLAVTTLGGLLCSERSQRKWEFVRDSEMWNLDDENGHGILPALRLSYNHLKPHVKQCFAFCAIFPQDYKIEKELVIKLWMAHGFIPTERGMELEDIGNDIFDELVMRSFFQDVKVYVKIKKQIQPGMLLYISDGTTFQMHDLMHDLAHSVMENEYRVVHNGKSKDISSRIRHVSSNGLGILAASLPKAQMLRTYVMLEEVAFQFPCDVGLFKCLRALDFMRQDKQEVEKWLLTSLGNLQHLRYLNFSFTLIEMLPESLTSLCYLQTLILRGCEMLCELPKEMCKLTNLRCLDITDCDKLTHMPPMMGKLSCLQELSNFIVGRTNEIACSGIGELQGLNLRGRLGIQFLKNITDDIHVPRDPLINKSNLTSLDLWWGHRTRYTDKEIEVLQGLQPHRSLKKLSILFYGGLNFPSWMMDTTLTELVEITLSGCWRCSHLPPLGELPFLKVLTIDGLKNVECIGNEFYGNEVSGGFPSLEKLDIRDMQNLKTWSGLEWKGERVFPSLVKLEIWYCPMLSTLEFFPDIKDLNVDQGMVQSLKNLKSFESMHQQNCNQLSFANEDQIRIQRSLRLLIIKYCDKLIFSGLGFRYLSSLQTLIIFRSNEFAHVAHELSFLTSLEELWLDRCHGLKSLTKGIGNLTSLRSLYIDNCLEMVSLPRELQRLSALKDLSICGCPTLEIRCTKDTGEDWDKIQHIPRIMIGGHHFTRD
ncbi:hypothetical protein AAC387_Pa03g0817 [Persea americana]